MQFDTTKDFLPILLLILNYASKPGFIKDNSNDIKVYSDRNMIYHDYLITKNKSEFFQFISANND